MYGTLVKYHSTFDLPVLEYTLDLSGSTGRQIPDVPHESESKLICTNISRTAVQVLVLWISNFKYDIVLVEFYVCEVRVTGKRSMRRGPVYVTFSSRPYSLGQLSKSTHISYD